MVLITFRFLLIICLYFTVANSEPSAWVWPASYVDDGNSIIESTCGTYLKAGETLNWHTEKPKDRIATYILPKYDGFRSLKLIWPLTLLSIGEKVYCVKSGTNVTRHYLHPIIFQKDNIKRIPDEWGPWLTPETFVDDGGPVVELTCWAYLYKEDILSWSHIQESNIIAKLATVQQESTHGYVKMKLRKTLEPSDNGTQIYCVKEDQKTGKLKESRRMPLTFARQIDTFETPYVTVEPSTDVVLYDEDEELEFVCGGSQPADGRALTWHLQAPDQQQATVPVQSYRKSRNLNRLSLTMQVAHHRSRLYCAQDFTLTLSNGTVRRYGERARSILILVLHRGQCVPGDSPQVAPEKFIDDRKQYFQFTCYMFLQPGQILSWYQSKGSAHSDEKLLKLVQLQDPRSKEGEWVVLTLNKTLEPSDNGSELYCAQQSVLPGGSFSEVLNETERISLTLQRYIPTLGHAFVTIEPKYTNVYFDVNTALRLTCSGSEPVDGRNYTWFRRDAEYSLTLIDGQKYNKRTNLNVLEMSVDESHHMVRLACVQGFLAYIRHGDGSWHYKIYGELAKPKIITLIQREESSARPMNPFSIPGLRDGIVRRGPAVGGAGDGGGVGAVQAARRAPRAPRTSRAKTQAHYGAVDGPYAQVSREMASPQVPYAELGLPARAAGAARAPPALAPRAYVCAKTPAVRQRQPLSDRD